MTYIALTPSEQNDLTVALRLENAGFTASAHWLRNQIPALKTLNWEDEPVPLSAASTVKWSDLLRAHRGSLPPVVTVTPVVVTPAPRADQIVS